MLGLAIREKEEEISWRLIILISTNPVYFKFPSADRKSVV